MTATDTVQEQPLAYSPHGRVRIGKLTVDLVDRVTALRIIDAAVVERSLLHVVTANMQFLSLAARAPAFADLVRDAGLVVGDGVPVIWLSRIEGHPIPQRITGHYLVQGCAALAAERHYRIALLGGAVGVGAAAAAALQSRHPELLIVGVYTGVFSDDGSSSRSDENETLIQSIRRDSPDILLVAMGCPKQERWIKRYIDKIDVPVCIGVGGVFDVLAGRRNRAPKLLRAMGMEWLFRLVQEPGRLWRRYLAQDLPTLMSTAMALAKARVRARFSLPRESGS